MKAYLVFIGVCAAVSSVSVLASPACDPAYECKAALVDEFGDTHNFDFSSLCSSTDIVMQDASRHNYHAQVCGTTNSRCYPGWQTTYSAGVAIQYWGDTPSCQTADCKDGQGNNVCCTAQCEVLGVGKPNWALLEPSDAEMGGVKATFRGAAPSDDDPHWCPFNPKTGAQLERQVEFLFYCDLDVETITAQGAIQNATDDCSYRLQFATKYACDPAGLSGGLVFCIIFFSLLIVYCVGGVMVSVVRSRGKSAAIPNEAFWDAFWDHTLAGFIYVGHGCNKTRVPKAGGAYQDIADSHQFGHLMATGGDASAAKPPAAADAPGAGAGAGAGDTAAPKPGDALFEDL